MSRVRLSLTCLACVVLALASPTRAQEAQPQQKSKFDQLVEGKTKSTGMWTLYHKDQQLLVELKGGDYNEEFLVMPSIARGIGSGMVIGGMSWNLDDEDVIWKFKKSGEKVFVLSRNVRFRAKPNSPEATAVDIAYNDSVLYALPVLAKSPGGGDLVDMTSIFMSDDQHIGQAIGGGFRFVNDRSTWAKVKAFENNIELQVAAVYSGSGNLDKVPDTRGVQVNVHYSIAQLPKLGAYKPRFADDRVGYFLTAIKDFSDKDDDQHFVRYITRWNLEKLDGDIQYSPPKQPIKFWIEKTVPVFLRPTVEAGISEWNKAFEKLGFANAIKVELLPDGVDPEDVNYNTFRWITSEVGFAMGPSRVDPRTGQILDADIIFDSTFLRSWKEDYETLTPEDAQRLLPNWSPADELAHASGRHRGCACCQEMQRHMGVAAAILLGQGVVAKDGKLPDQLIHEGLKEVVMHEVGHTLGLRHNFKASTWKSLEELGDADKGKTEGTVASVMDYSPANIVPKGDKQGLYFSQTIGPYDYWAIEYGYKPLKGDEKKELAAIACRAGEPGLDYATDEDTMSTSADPLSNRSDLGKDPLAFVRRQMKHADELIPKVVERAVDDGDGYQRARQAFGLLFSEYWRSALFAARFPGGVYVHRDHKGDKGGRPPFRLVEPEKQREAMKLIVDSAFASPQYDGAMLNHLASTRWSHWGIREPGRVDYPIHNQVGLMQTQILGLLLNSTTLERILDNEYKTPADQAPYTLAEHMRALVDGAFSEWKKADAAGEFSDRQPYINSLRRNLQRQTLTRMASLVTQGGSAPPDARTLARMHLTSLGEGIDGLLKSGALKLDDYSRAHLQDSRERIRQALNVEVSVPGVN